MVSTVSSTFLCEMYTFFPYLHRFPLGAHVSLHSPTTSRCGEVEIDHTFKFVGLAPPYVPNQGVACLLPNAYWPLNRISSIEMDGCA